MHNAAQFMPFAALNGYYDLVHEQEHVSEPRRTLTDERVEEVSRMLARIRKGDLVEVTHYDHAFYLTTTGVIRQVDSAFRALELQPSRRILFEDIWEIRLL